MLEPIARFPWMRALLFLVLAGCNNLGSPAITQLIQARQLAAEARVRFSRASDASNRVVMSDSDETTVKFSEESRSQMNALEKTLIDLEAVLNSLDFDPELKILEQAQNALARYRRLDREILTLAAESTNLKAERLAFGPAHDASQAFSDALLPVLQQPSPRNQECRPKVLALTAISAVREIETRQAPHIAASKDEVMTQLEKEMRAAELIARDALHDLAPLGAPPAAAAALQRFLDRNREILSLSRRNSNLRSLELSLGEKRPLTAACEQSLQELSDALSQRTFPGTR